MCPRCADFARAVVAARTRTTTRCPRASRSGRYGESSANHSAVRAIRDVKWPRCRIVGNGLWESSTDADTRIGPDSANLCDISKMAAGRYQTVYSQLYGIRCGSVGRQSPPGPRRRGLVVRDLIQRSLGNATELLVCGDGSQVRGHHLSRGRDKWLDLCVRTCPTGGRGLEQRFGFGEVRRKLVEEAT